MKPFYKTPGGIIVIGSVIFALVMIYRTVSSINKDIAEVENTANTFQQRRDSGLLILQRIEDCYRDWETDRKSTRLNSSH